MPSRLFANSILSRLATNEFEWGDRERLRSILRSTPAGLILEGGGIVFNSRFLIAVLTSLSERLIGILPRLISIEAKSDSLEDVCDSILSNYRICGASAVLLR